MLKVEGLGLRFGGIQAISDISFEANPGEIVGLIGPNGAGKTSLFNCMTGFYRPTAGRIRLGDTDITARPPYRISRLGLRRTFQNIRLFNELPVLTNVMAGSHGQSRPEAELATEARALCAELEIDAAFLMRPAGDLPHGVQRRVELARALIASPRIVLVDEPGAGLNGAEKRLIIDLLRRAVQERQIGVVLIEHDIGMIARASDRVVVLDRGRVLCAGTADEVRRDPAVISAYLGT